MFALIFSALASKLSALKFTLIAAAFVGIMTFAGAQTLRLQVAQSSLAVAAAEKATLITKIEAQNAGIKAVQAERERLAVAAQVADMEVARIQIESAAALAALKGQKPKTCQDALDVLARAARGPL